MEEEDGIFGHLGEEGGVPGVASGTGAQVTCGTCGSDRFICEGGFYFCEICQTQSQDARQVVEREEYGAEGFRSRAATFRQSEGGPSLGGREAPKTRFLSKYEAFNGCLKVLSDRLVELGFAELLKTKVFNLWTSYLIKRKAIFISPNHEGPVEWLRSVVDLGHGPECGCKEVERTKVRFRPRIAKGSKQYKLAHAQAAARRAQRWGTTAGKKTSTTGGAEDGEEEGTNADVSLTVKKRRRTLAKKRAIESEYSSQLQEMLGGEEESFGVGKTTAKASKIKRKRCKLTQDSKSVLHVVKGTYISHKRLNPEFCTMKTLFAIIFIALRQIGYNVLITDILRLVWSGNLYMSSFQLFLGDDNLVTNTSAESALIGYNHPYLWPEYADTITDVVDYLGIEDFRRPTFLEYLPKFIDDFALPRELECFIIQMDKLVPIDRDVFYNQLQRLAKCKMMPEFLILSVITFVLKLLFGLDDVTERYQSEFAKTVNQVLDEYEKVSKGKQAAGQKTRKAVDEWTRLFVLEDWFLYLRRRSKIFKAELNSPLFYESLTTNGITPTPSLVDSWQEVYTGHKGKTRYQKMEKSQEALETKIDELVDQFSRHLPTTSHRSIVSSYASTSLPQEDLLNEYKRNYPSGVIDPMAASSTVISSLVNNFAKRRVDFVYNPGKYTPLLKKAGYKVKVLKGNAHQHFSCDDLRRMQPEGEKVLLLFQPYLLFDEYLPHLTEWPKSLTFFVSQCSLVLGGAKDASLLNEQFDFVLRKVIRHYSSHVSEGILNIFPYDLSDDEATVADAED